MTEKPQGAGSIWNPNSWHWEMKNYTQVSKKLLEDKILQMDIKDESNIIKNTKVKFVKAEAEVNIRKGKQHLVYQFELEVSFESTPRSQLASKEPIQGTYCVKQIASDDLTDISIEDVKSQNKTQQSTKIKNFIKKSFKNYYVQLFQNFAEDLSKIQGDPQKLQQDKKKREQATVEMQKAREQKGAQKQRLLQQQRKKQKQMKVQFAKNAKKQ